MKTFRYRARDATGSLVQDALLAESEEDVAATLLAQGRTPLRIEAIGEQQDVMQQFQRWMGARVKPQDLLLFTRQMYSVTKSGIPLVRGLRSLEETTHAFILREALQALIIKVESGRSLSVAMAEHPNVFTPLYCALVEVGEESGRMEDAFSRLYEYLSFEGETLKKIKTALRYPAMVVAAVGIAIAVLMALVIPKFAGIFSRVGADLPLPTRVIMSVSQFMEQHWFLLICLTGAAAVAARLFVATPAGRLFWDRYKLRLPVVGSILQRGAVARFARSFGVSYQAGVPIGSALVLVEKAIGNAHLAELLANMREHVEHGESLSRAARGTGLLTPLALQMMAMGEETGELDRMMEEVADFYEREIDYEVENLSAAIEPILTMVVGILVLILALAVFLPMWDMFSAISGKR